LRVGQRVYGLDGTQGVKLLDPAATRRKLKGLRRRFSKFADVVSKARFHAN
jgi:hypothetical protein